MSKKDKKNKSKRVIRVDFTGVDVRKLVPEGQYHCKVAETSMEEGDKAPYIKWTFEILDEEYKGQKLYLNTSLSAQSLWNLRNLLETLGVETPAAATDVDLDEVVNLELMIRVEHETYEGKDRPRVTDFSPIEETASAEDDEDKGDDEEEAEDESEEDEEEEEEAEDESEEDEEDGKITASDVKEMDEAELTSLVKKHKLKCDLSTKKKLANKVALVLDALEKADLLAE